MTFLPRFARHGRLRIPPAAKTKSTARVLFVLAGLAGFEPTGDGVKVRCLTAWRQPNIEKQSRTEVGFCAAVGDPSEIRTPDTLIKSQVLCQLS